MEILREMLKILIQVLNLKNYSVLDIIKKQLEHDYKI